MSDLRETTWNNIAGDDYGTFFTSERKWLNKINKLKDKFPDDVEIAHINEDGSMLVRVPIKWFKISPPRQVNMTEEQKSAAAERLNRARTGGQ